jgi:adenylosuccinate synthase
MKAIITVGLGFGDEGKGATVDFLARELAADLVVRYSGGAQAGHNVVLDDGRRHTFAQFGAGTLAGVPGYLGPRVIISPLTMVPEAEHLRELGVADPFALLMAHPDCLVATAYHAAMNRLRELARGGDRHGSCGLGIGETRHYWLRYGGEAIFAADLADRRTLRQKLTLLRERLLIEMQELPRLDPEWSEMLHASRPGREAELLYEAAAELRVADRPPPFETAIFEGAQGVLLDEWAGFHPYTTWGTVTPLHARELAEEWGIDEVETWGLTRAYSTRHGAGPFPTESRDWTAAIRDPGNPTNAWQGTIRSGPLDLALLDYAARVSQIDALAVTCLDQLPAESQLARRYSGLDRIEIPHGLKEQEDLAHRLVKAQPIFENVTESELLAALEEIAPIVSIARGPARGDRELIAATSAR